MRSTRTHVASLRTRLFVLIVVPLILVALASSGVRYWSAQGMSKDLYDDTLKVVAHAVAREVVLTKGDLLTDALLDSLVGALGDPIYYQVRAADGRFVTGYFDAPVPEADLDLPGGTPVFFDAQYHNRPVRAVILREFIADPDFDGWTTVQVWQTVSQRQALSLSLLGESAINLFLMVIAAAVLVWFGINRGLGPLTDLREAVALRNENELSPIRRGVPPEVAPLVETINTLFARLREELARRNAFIGNAAHQLRNPVAAIQAQAESALGTTDPAQRIERLQDLAEAARRLSRISHQLLNFDIAAEGRGGASSKPAEFSGMVAEVARRHVPRALSAGVDMELEPAAEPLMVAGNGVMLQEAIDNLIDNALKYGCPKGSRLSLVVRSDDGDAVLTVSDSGPGVPPHAHEMIFDRFVRLAEDGDNGCGLGLSIVRAIAQAAGGSASIVPTQNGCTVELRLPVVAAEKSTESIAALASNPQAAE
ncbi:sensor histidine kinase [Pelagibacterium lentulum]|uniref:histidine kinase n=1 Tax=Pelagibacterium lentulum TaxID=2029865 RepID=A0A916R5A7_9HYPH|nr:sensor histidine kinase [Pelagibacterium lentulum]GGA38554.1 sensor histidine kinase [Pelagibacterium lentulum]